jgi:hypothetical protein
MNALHSKFTDEFKTLYKQKVLSGEKSSLKEALMNFRIWI